MCLVITITRVKVNREGYDRISAYYGAGQTGHSWRLGGHAQGHVTGGDGRKTRAAALRAARKALAKLSGLRGQQVTIEYE